MEREITEDNFRTTIVNLLSQLDVTIPKLQQGDKRPYKEDHPLNLRSLFELRGASLIKSGLAFTFVGSNLALTRNDYGHSFRVLAVIEPTLENAKIIIEYLRLPKLVPDTIPAK